ncbi:MAG: hypothetical protein Q7J68_04775 [Thermoplasmata archaeon]|nr:hypothetical protein [Thermoplasmata archaeon]
MESPKNIMRLLPLIMLALLIFGTLSIPNATAAPVAALSLSGPEYGIYVNSLTTFTLTASEASDIWYRWDTNPVVKYTEPFHAEIITESASGTPALPMDLDESAHTLYYNCTGEIQKLATVHLDNTIPTTVLNFIGTHYSGDYQFIESDTQVTFTSSDLGSGVAEIRYAINNDPESVFTTPFTMPGMGLQTIFYYSVDNLGNREPERSVTISIDNDAPEIQITPGTPQFLNSGSTYISASTPISISFSDISEISYSEYKTEWDVWTNYFGPLTISMEGQHTIAARAADNLGHESTEISLVVIVDNTPPVVTVTGTSGDTIHMNKGGKLELHANDSGVGGSIINYSLDGGVTWEEYSQPLVIQDDTNVTYYATDALGNSMTPLTIRIYILGTPSPWGFYLGIALIVGGILVALSGFFFFRKKSTDSEPPVKKEVPRQQEEMQKSKRKKKRNI